MKLNALKLAVSAAIVSALSVVLLVLSTMYLGRGVAILKMLVPIMPGLAMDWQGAGFGAIYGFVDCFIYFGLVALLYNKLLVWKGIKLKIKGKAKGKKKK